MSQKKIRKSRFAAILALPLFIVLFQNCGNFKSHQVTNSSVSGASAIEQPKIGFATAPPSLINAAALELRLTFFVTAQASAAAITCQVDASAPVDCSNLTWRLTGLSEGDHTLTLRAEDSLGQKTEATAIVRVDTLPPVLTISQRPTDISNATAPVFAFSAVDTVSGVQNYQCSLDNSAFVECTSPRALTGLAVGAHSFSVRAVDVAGNVGPSVVVPWSIDLSAPTVSVTARPALFSNTQSASFSFAGVSTASPIAAYECQLDGAGYAACTSPKTYADLLQGNHTFMVRARTQTGTLSSVAAAAWTIDLTAPAAPVVVSATAAYSATRIASISFSATDSVSGIASYQCSLNGAAFAVCASPAQLKDLAEGPNSFSVRASDGAGNVSPAAQFNWTVDVTAPVLNLTAVPDAMTSSKSASFVFNATDAGGLDRFTCQLDGAIVMACTSPKAFENLVEGVHKMNLSVFDKAGNTKSLLHTWTISAEPGTLDGAQLYANNCAGCHAPLANSTKLGRSAAQISNAIGSVAVMGGLKGLTTAEIAAITAVLNPTVIIPPVSGNKADYGPDVTMVNKCDGTVLRGSARMSNRKLTKQELFNSVRDLVTDIYELNILSIQADFTYVDFVNQTPMQRAMNSYPSEASVPATAGDFFEKVHNQEQINSWLAFSDAWAQVFINYNGYGRFTTNDCVSRTANDACFTEFINRFGRKVWRRPLIAAEVQAFLSMKGADAKASIAKIVTYMLVAPDFMFLLEPGLSETAGRIRLSDYEVANRISYALSASSPDAALASAADAGQLKTVEQVDAQVRRLIVSERAKSKLRSFFADWMRLNSLHQPDVQWTQAAEIGQTPSYNPSLLEEMEREVYDFTNYIVWNQNGSFNSLMTAPISVPREINMSLIYKTAFTTSGTPQSTPNNPGLLTRAGVLVSAGLTPNAIMRGVMIKRRVLCDSMPSPDFSVVASRVNEIGVQDPVLIPNHEIVKKTTNSAACMACHSQINPLGFAFEAYNPLGQKQTVQKVPLSVFEWEKYGKKPGPYPQGAESRFISEFPLPGAQTGVMIENGLPTSYANSDELISAIGKSEKARACMAVRLFRHFERRSENANDSCALSEMQALLKQDKPVLDVFVKALANEDIFWRKPK